MAKKIVPQEPCLFCGTTHQGACPPLEVVEKAELERPDKEE